MGENSSVWCLHCAISMELLSACAISSPPLLALVRLDAFWQLIKRVFAHVWQKRTNAHDWCDDSISFYYILFFSCHIYAPFLKDSVLCSCFFVSFFLIYMNIVHHLHCCEVSIGRFEFSLCSISWWPGKRALLLHPTLHALSLCHTISQMHIRDNTLLVGLKEFLLWPVWEQF